MFELNLSFTITAIIALTSLISPWISNKINNKHQKEMKLLEYEQERYSKTVLYKRQIFENYVAAAGEFITICDSAIYKDFGNAHTLAYLYANDELRLDMEIFHKALVEHNKENSSYYFSKIVPQVNAILKTLK